MNALHIGDISFLYLPGSIPATIIGPAVGWLIFLWW